MGAGFLLRTPTRLFENAQGALASLSVGLLVEGGYTLVGPAKLALVPTDTPLQAIDLQEPALGELNRSGPYVRASVVLRFGL